MAENPSKLKNMVISLVPILILTGITLYYVGRNKSLIDLQKQEKGPVFPAAKTATQSQLPAAIPGENKTYSSGLNIKGDDRFKEQITQAMKLIWLYDRDSFLVIRKYVFEIRKENRTTSYMEDGAPVMAISEDHAFRSLTWAAGIIAHNAWHAYYDLNSKKPAKKGVPEPGQGGFFSGGFTNPLERKKGNLETFFTLEGKACEFQLKILEAVGAPKSETRLVSKREKKDFSVGHDGDYFVK